MGSTVLVLTPISEQIICSCDYSEGEHLCDNRDVNHNIPFFSLEP